MLRKITIFELLMISGLFVLRFLLATFVSVNYTRVSFYQNYKERLSLVNSRLELRVSTQKSLANLDHWAEKRKLSIIKDYIRYQSKRVIAQR